MSDNQHKTIPKQDTKRQHEPVWCVIANVVDATLWDFGGQVMRQGTRHFSGGQIVYCLPPLLGGISGSVVVVGPHRRTHRYIRVIVPGRHLTNWQVGLVDCPAVVAELRSQWDGTDESRALAERIVAAQRLHDIARPLHSYH